MNASVNGISVAAERWPNLEVAVVRELLRQRAVARGFVEPDIFDGEVVAAAIEHLLAEEVKAPTPSEPECRRYYEARREEFHSGELVHARHILFQVTSGVPVAELRARAERTLADLLRSPERFGAVARELSNCPSGQQGGNLGQIGRGDTVPEFEKVLFRPGPTGVLRELVKTRHGFHIVAIDRRIPGETLPFDMVRDQIAERLTAGVEAQALRQYVLILAGNAEVSGVDLEAAKTPLVQ